jgi:hypothetical protein
MTAPGTSISGPDQVSKLSALTLPWVLRFMSQQFPQVSTAIRVNVHELAVDGHLIPRTPTGGDIGAATTPSWFSLCCAKGTMSAPPQCMIFLLLIILLTGFQAPSLNR